MFLLFSVKQQNGLSVNVLTSLSNKGVVLALVAMAQTLVVLTGGFDLSAGMILTMASCLASVVVNGPPGQIALGALAVLASGLAAGGSTRRSLSLVASSPSSARWLPERSISGLLSCYGQVRAAR